MYRKMLVPLDGSELAETVCTYAKELAGRLDIDVVLLHVSDPSAPGMVPMETAYIDHMAEIVKRQVADVQKSTAQPGKSKRVKVTGELLVGYAAEEILRYADENAIDLIVLASHGRSGLKRWTIGSVASKVMGATKIPVWLIKPGTPKEIPYDKWSKRTLVVALDGSELAECILPHTVALAQQRSNEPVEVLLLWVCEPPVLPSYYQPNITVGDVTLNWKQHEQQEIAKCKQAAQQYLSGVEKRLKASHISNVRSEVLVGRPADEITDYVHKHPFSLLIIATHGRSGVKRWVYGSVANNVLQGVSNPILLIRPC